MLIIGVTGSIASGKNFVADSFEKLGAVVFDADEQVHQILNNDAVVLGKITQSFPSSIVDHKIDRRKLGDLVFKNQSKLNLLEKIIHPVVSDKRKEFIESARKRDKNLVILNIPLLFEKGSYLHCHKNILVKLPDDIQRERFLERSKINSNDFNEDLFIAKFDDILQTQMPNSAKEELADYIIDNGQSRDNTLAQIKEIFNKLIN
jgi:dephospho-CoA kinase